MLGTLTVAACLTIAAGPAENKGGRLIHVPHCQVFLIHDVSIPAVDAGQLSVSQIQAGMSVSQGQVLMQLNNELNTHELNSAQVALRSAEARAEDQIEIQLSQKSLELAQAELKQDQEINQRSPGTIPESDIRRKQLAYDQTQLQVERSRFQQRLARLSVDAEQAKMAMTSTRLRRRQIEAPFNGLIIDVFRQTGEWVNQGDPVARIIRLDELRVDGFVDARQFAAQELAGRPVRVTVEIPSHGKFVFKGSVSNVSPIVLAGSRYRVQAEVKNRQANGVWLLEPGRIVAMEIDL